MAYADYTFYADVFKGTKLSAAEFDYFAERASDVIDSMTDGRAKAYEYRDFDKNLKKACCAMAETLLKYENGGGISSETVGKHTVTYATGISTSKTENQALCIVANRYLGNTGLLYAGI